MTRPDTTASRPARTDRPGPRRLAAVAAAGLVAAAVWGVFHPVLGYQLTGFDEQSQVVENPLLADLSAAGLWRLVTTPVVTSYYPLRSLSLALDRALWGLDPTGFHLTNLVLHVANAWLLLALGVRLLADAGRRGPGAALWAGAGAALFALHPVVVETVAWVGAREELLMTLATLAALHLHLAGRRAAEAGRRRAGGIAWHAGAAAAVAAACLSSVSGAVAALLLPAMDLLRRPRPSLGALAAADLPPLAIAAGAVLLKLAGPSGFAPGAEAAAPAGLARGALVANVYRLNLQTLVWPADLAPAYPSAAPDGLASWGAVTGVAAALITLGLLAAAVLWRRPVVALGLAWVVLALAPSAQVLAHHIHRADRLLYLPLAGLATALAAWAAGLAKGWARTAVAALAGAVLVACGARAHQVLPVWRDSLALFGRAVEAAPQSPSARNNLGLALAEAGRTSEADARFREALALNPRLATALVNLANLELERGRPTAAEALLRRAVEAAPNDPVAHFNLGNLHAARGQPEAALAHYRRAAALAPRDPEVASNLAATLMMLRRYDDAADAYRRVVALWPDDPVARLELARALMAAGRREAALGAAHEALALARAAGKAELARHIEALIDAAPGPEEAP